MSHVFRVERNKYSVMVK